MAAGVKWYDKTGGVQLTGKAFGDSAAGATFPAEKFSIVNTGDRDIGAGGAELRLEQEGTNDGYTLVRVGRDTATVIPPYEVTGAAGSPGAGGVWSGTGVKYYRLTATNATGETVGSLEVAVNVDDTTKKVTLNWTQPAGVTGIKVYRSTTPGVYTTPALRATLGAVATYMDDGSAVGAGALPTENTTAGGAPTYGSPPTLGTSPLSLGTVKKGQTIVWWLNRLIPASTPAAGNTRALKIRIVEL